MSRTSPFPRRPTAAVLAAALLTSIALAPTAAASTGDRARLLVADPKADALHVVNPASGAVTGTIAGRKLNEHAGVATLPDGRALFVDELNHALVAVQLSGRPRVVGSAPVQGEVAHLALDPAGRYAVVSAAGHHDHEDQAAEHEEEPGQLTVVDLESWKSHSVAIATGEPGVAVDGLTDTVLVRNDEPAALQSFPRESVLAHSGTEPLAPATAKDIGEHGHGEAYSGRYRVAATATARGVDLTSVRRDGGFGDQRTAPWDVSGRTGGRAFYVRLHDDASTLVSYVRNDADPDWTRWAEDAYLLDVRSGAASRVPLGAGYVYRFGLSDRLAGYVVQGPETDELVLVDVDADGAGFGKVTKRVGLGALPGGPRPGASPFSAQSRRIALTDTGRTAYVTAGGQGRVDVVDTGAGQVLRSLRVPTALNGGGAVAVWEPGVRHSDTIGR